jgi:hypothetical protein
VARMVRMLDQREFTTASLPLSTALPEPRCAQDARWLVLSDG